MNYNINQNRINVHNGRHAEKQINIKTKHLELNIKVHARYNKKVNSTELAQLPFHYNYKLIDEVVPIQQAGFRCGRPRQYRPSACSDHSYRDRFSAETKFWIHFCRS